MSDNRAAALSVRVATPADNEALIALAAACPMEGDIGLCSDRAPDFFALSRLEGDPWRVGVIEVDGKPVACVGAARRHLYVNGEPQYVAYVGDLKVHPEFRRAGVGRALANWAVATAEELVGPAGVRIFTVLGGNTALTNGVLPSIAATAGNQTTRRGRLRSHNIQLLWRKSLQTKGIVVDRAVPADVAAMAKLWQRVAPTRQFAPVHDAESLGAWISESPGLSVSDFLLARRPGSEEVVGFLGLWDQHVFKQMRIVSYSRKLARVKTVLNAASPLTKAPKLPPPGGELRYRTVVNICVPQGDADVMNALLRHAHEMLRGNGYSFFSVGLDTLDPLDAAVRGFYSEPTDVDVFADPVRTGGTELTLDPQPLHFEIATV